MFKLNYMNKLNKLSIKNFQVQSDKYEKIFFEIIC